MTVWPRNPRRPLACPSVPSPDPKLLVVGGGKMGEALVGGLLAAGWAQPGEILVIEPSKARRAELETAFAGVPVVEQVHSRH